MPQPDFRAALSQAAGSHASHSLGCK